MATLAELRTRARQRSEMELGPGQSDTDHFITNAELNSYINASVAELYDLILSAYDSDYYLTSTNPTVTGGSNEVSLPADFYKLKAVEKQNGSNWENIHKFNFNDRNKGGLRYRIRKDKLTFTDNLSSGDVIRIWYSPKATTLSLDADTFDGVNNWEEYVVIDAAIKMLTKEESDTSTLMSQKQAIGSRIMAMSDDRDAGEPDSISDLDYRRFLDTYGWETRD